MPRFPGPNYFLCSWFEKLGKMRKSSHLSLTGNETQMERYLKEKYIHTPRLNSLNEIRFVLSCWNDAFHPPNGKSTWQKELHQARYSVLFKPSSYCAALAAGPGKRLEFILWMKANFVLKWYRLYPLLLSISSIIMIYSNRGSSPWRS